MKIISRILSLFSNYKFIYFPFIIIFFGWFIFCYFPPFIPDFFKIENYSKIYELFNLIISSLVSLIGIYITVSLVAYEFFKQKSGVDFHKSFMINSLSASYISFSVLTIIFAFLSSIIISDLNPSQSEISVIYFNAILFVLIILTLIPVAFNLFSSLKPDKLASDEINKIDNQSIFINNNEIDDIDNEAELYENDSLIKVTNIVIALIAVSEDIKAQVIIQKVTIRLSNLIIDEENLQRKEYITERLISFYIKIIDFSLLQPNNSTILRCIWKAIDIMYNNLIDRKETSFHYEIFRKKFFERFINRLFTNNKEEEIIDGIETIKNIIENQVMLNMPDDNDIISLYHLRKSLEINFQYPSNYTEKNYTDSKNWSEIAIKTFDLLSFIINKSINSNKPDLINKCFEKLNDLNFKFHLEKIGKYKLTFFYIETATIISDYSYLAFEKNVFQKGSDAKNLLPSLFDDLIEKEEISSHTVLCKYCYLLIDLQKINKLDRWFLGGLTIGNIITLEGGLGQLARRCSYNYHKNKTVQNCLHDCIDTYIILKEYYETQPNNNFHLYIAIKDRLTTILDILSERKIDNKKLIQKLKLELKSFKKLEDYEQN